MRTRSESKFHLAVFVFGDLGGWVSPRFPYVTQVVESFSSDLLRALVSYSAEPHLESCQTSTREFFWKNNQRLNTWTFSAENLHRRCSNKLRMYLRLKVLLMWSVGGLQVYISCCRSEVVEARSNYKNFTCGDSTGSNRIEKTGLVYLLDLFGGIREEGWGDLMCVKPF